MQTRSKLTRSLLFPLALGVLALAPAAAEAKSNVSGDFNGDGHDDLAVGVPAEDIRRVGDNAGAVSVIYGSENRLAAPGNQFWHQDSAGIQGAAESNDNFGTALAAGDFQGDGFDDLAVSTPREDSGEVTDTGVVQVIFGTKGGLVADGAQLWFQGNSGVADTAEEGDFFGSSLTAESFNLGGPDDLAIGVPSEDIGGDAHAGAVNVLYGNSATGLNAANDQFWHQDSAGVADDAEPFDGFGSSLAAGDFDGSGHGDLAVGTPRESVGSSAAAGAVNVIAGSAFGLSASPDDPLWHQDSAGIPNVARTGELFGSSLATGDFDGSGHDDLAVGVPDQALGSANSAGAVHSIYGTSSGLRANGNQFWHQDSAGIAEAAEANDEFGTALTAGDFDGNGEDDLAVGVPRETVGSLTFAGALNAIYGSAARLSANGNQLWHQDSQGMGEHAELSDEFATSLTAGDFNGSGHDDLAVGVIREDTSSLQDAGAVHAIYGSRLLLRAADNRLWHQDSAGIEDAVERGDLFGLDLPA